MLHSDVLWWVSFNYYQRLKFSACETKGVGKQELCSDLKASNIQ